ncbi:MAG: energy transducer TonB [Bacteroidaceae bacterium]|nr:energy transducer TonB [Bacteroidaceae bacterium]
MAKIDLISKQWCDLVFAGRNKDYGAYRLRANAGKRNLYAFFTLCALILAIFALIGLVQLGQAAVEAFEDESATELSQLEEEEQEEQKEEEKKPEKLPEPEQKKEETPQENTPQEAPAAAVEAVAARATETFTTVAIVDKVDESRELSSQQNLQDSRAAFSNRTYHGDAGGTVVATAGMNVGGTSHDPNAGRGVIGGKGTSTGVEAVRKVDTEIYSESGVAVMAQFPGGEKALLDYLGKNIKYPAIAVEQDLQGTVNLRFVVEKDGSVGDVRVIKSLSKECDAEAIRVLKRAPRFSPAKNERGEPVRVWFSLPVRFEIH